MVTTIKVISIVCAAWLLCAHARPIRGSAKNSEEMLTTEAQYGNYGIITQAMQNRLQIRMNSTTDKSEIVKECEKYARIVVNGKNRIEEVIATFGDQHALIDEEEERRRISEAVARVLNGKSGNKLDKYFRCVQRFSGGSWNTMCRVFKTFDIATTAHLYLPC